MSYQIKEPISFNTYFLLFLVRISKHYNHLKQFIIDRLAYCTLSYHHHFIHLHQCVHYRHRLGIHIADVTRNHLIFHRFVNKLWLQSILTRPSRNQNLTCSFVLYYRETKDSYHSAFSFLGASLEWMLSKYFSWISFRSSDNKLCQKQSSNTKRYTKMKYFMKCNNVKFHRHESHQV